MPNMEIHSYSLGGGKIYEPCVLALGFFDGVHLAHRELLKTARTEAQRRGLPLAVFTFPAECTFLKGGDGRIYGTREKMKLLEALGVDRCIVADFRSVSGLDAEEFINRVAIAELGAVCAVSGYNFRYGQGARGDAELLLKTMRAAGLDALILPEYKHGGITVSSTAIRELISKGRIKEANVLLGGEFFFTGTVEHGRAEGRSFGFPTVNTQLTDGRQAPRLGVYKTRIPIDGAVYTGLTNIGKCPTFGERAVHLETYILGYEGELYGRELDIFLVSFIRDEKQFSSKEELVMQINIDIKTILSEDR